MRRGEETNIMLWQKHTNQAPTSTKKEKKKMKWKQVSEQSCMVSCEVRSVDTKYI